jgi:hypothetical protein
MAKPPPDPLLSEPYGHVPEASWDGLEVYGAQADDELDGRSLRERWNDVSEAFDERRPVDPRQQHYVAEAMHTEQVTVSRVVFASAQDLPVATLARRWRLPGVVLRVGHTTERADGALVAYRATVRLRAMIVAIPVDVVLTPVGARAVLLSIVPRRRLAGGVSWLRRPQWYARMNPLADEMTAALRRAG